MDPCEEFKVLCAENKVFPPDYICRQLASLARRTVQLYRVII